jgi:hypothetical protein
MAPRTPISFSDYERDLLDRARGRTKITQYIREAAVARAAYELGQRSADPGKTIREIIDRLRRDEP